MKEANQSFGDLASWVDSQQSQGLYFFDREEAKKVLGISEEGLKKAAMRMARKRRIFRVHGRFYVIIPLEYFKTGVLPADWFINDLMEYMSQPYYVGLLSAAQLHGAAHQQPQEFQIVTPNPLRTIRFKNLVIRFFFKTKFGATPLNRVKVQTGLVNISSPEATAFDLLRYARTIGGVDRVYTVLQELGEVITPSGLLEAAKADGTLSYAQRLGWLLEQAGYGRKKVEYLFRWVKEKKPLPIKLDTSLPVRGALRDNKWNILVNTELESEL